MNALTCNGSRVLTPDEVDRIRKVISKPSSRALFDLLLYTGLRLSEVKQLMDNPQLFDQERRTITIRSGKAKATQRSRNVTLSENGIEAVKAYLLNPTAPNSPTAWQMNLIRWSRQAHLQVITGVAPDSGGSNPYGITVRTSRKSWESWLLTAFPDRAVYIALSQGHTESTALRHYLNLSFTQAEKDTILKEVRGWDHSN